MYIETRARSLVKTISWRVAGTAVTAVLVFLFTKKLGVALAIGGFEAAGKLVVYFFHERAWNRISFGRRAIKPSVIWFTGLSGSGKSTIAQKVVGELQAQGFKTEYLDGDMLRQIFPRTGFSRQDREDHVKRAGFLASRLENQGIFVVASLISPYQSSRNEVRQLCRNFLEVYVSTPLEICEKRDPKGLYAKARRGEIKNFTGIDDPYEIPTRPELVIDTSQIDLQGASDLVLNLIRKRV
jgi:adenylylsulfate kinase